MATHMQNERRDRAPTVMGRMAGWRWFRTPWRRRLVFAALAFLFAIFSLFPRSFEARVILAPQDSLVAGSLLSPTPFDGSNFIMPGLPQPVDIELAIAQSREVARATAVPGDVGIRALRAGIIEISVIDTDPARAVTSAGRYARAVIDRLDTLRAEQIEARRTSLAQRIAETGDRLRRAEAALAAAPASHERIAARDVSWSLHAGYLKLLDRAARDEQTADIRLAVLDRAALDPQRRINTGPAALMLFILLLGLTSEFYVHRLPRGIAQP